MGAITIRNLSDEVHRALKQRAAENGRSAEAEVRDIIRTAVMPEERVLLGSELRALGQKYGGIELEERKPEFPRPVIFE